MFAETKFFHKAGEGSGGGGSDPHNLGYYADLTALQTAHPTGTDGDFAILGSTDTIWVWDSGTSAWKDTDTKGQVTSVNGQTGDVVLDLLPSQTGQSGKFLTTDGTDASWGYAIKNTATIYPNNSVGILGICSGANTISIGVGASAREGSLVIGPGAECSATTGAIVIGRNAKDINNGGGNVAPIIIGQGAKLGATGGTVAPAATVIGNSAEVNKTGGIVLGGYKNKATQDFAIQIGGLMQTNSEAGTLCIGSYYNNAYVNYKLLDSDGTIPADRLPNAINKYSTMPTAVSANEGWIVQFTGTTDSTYTHGYIYECKAQGTDPETYAWEAVEVQAGGGGGLPSQTGNSGKFLTTDGTNASWGEALKRVGNQSKDLGILASYVAGSSQGGSAIGIGAESESYGGSSVAIGFEAVAGTATYNTYSCVALGPRCKATGLRGIAIGYNAQATATCAMQIGPGTNSTANTCQLGYYNGGSFTTYQLLDFTTGTIPAARHATLPAADGTYTLQLVIADGVPTLSWVAV